MFKKIFIFIMIFAIVFVFVFDTNTALATTATFGGIYGLELGSEMLAFLLASLAVGVTYNSLVEVEQLFKASELIDWDEILGSAPDPPPGGGHNPNKKLITALLLGVPGGAFLSSIFGDLISWFRGLGGDSGENEVIIGNMQEGIINGYHYVYSLKVDNNGELNNSIKIDASINGVQNNDRVLVVVANYFNLRLVNFRVTNVTKFDNLNVRLNYHIEYYVDDTLYNQDKNIILSYPQDTQYELPTLEEPTIVHYNVKPNSSVITNIPPTTIPQPDISNLPGIETITTPQGEEKIIYPGDFEDLVNDIVNNITFEDIKNIIPGTNSYIVSETEQGLNIDVGQESPYPDVNTDPIEDTSAYQGTTIGLLQSIINWLSLIRNEISSLPDKLFEVPSDLSLNFDNLKLNGFQERFPFSIPWDIAQAITVFSRTPSEPDLTIDMETNYFAINHEIDISAISLPLRFARYVASVFFVLYLANKTRDLIKW